MQNELNIIIDNTHLSGSHEAEYRKLVDDWNLSNVKQYEFKVREFHEDIDTCIERDKLRGESSVGEAVIRRMSKESGWGGKPPEFSPVTINKGFDACIIVDIDGTLAFMN
jgi:predicted kinase